MQYGKGSASERQTFENFYAGENGETAVALAKMVASQPGMYNPVFFYGPAGMGKTHLLHAIADAMGRQHPDARIELVSCTEFVNRLVSAIVNGMTEEFRQFYAEADALLLDDVQEIAGKEATQEELIRLFDMLIRDGKQIVMTADRSPSSILAVEDRTISRFDGGVLAEISGPDFTQRRRLVTDYAVQRYHQQLPEDIAVMLASKISAVRSLQGAAAKLCAWYEMEGRYPDMERALKLTEDYWKTR